MRRSPHFMQRSPHFMRRFLQAGFAVLTLAALWACAPTHPSPASEESGKASEDRIIAGLVAAGKIDQAQKVVDSLHARKDPADREIAVYWRAVCWLYRDEPDSALAIFEFYHGKWSGSMRRVHSEAFLRLARNASTSRALLRQHENEIPKTPPPDKALLDRVDALQKESVDLRAQIGQLESERLKYQKLIKDLETIH